MCVVVTTNNVLDKSLSEIYSTSGKMAFLKLHNSHKFNKLLHSSNSAKYFLFDRSITSGNGLTEQQYHKKKIINELDATKIVEFKNKWDSLDTTFNDFQETFKSKTTWEIFRAYIVYQLCSSSYLVENNIKLMNCCKAIFGEKLFALVMKLTFYGHFVAGENENRIVPTLKRLRSFGVKPILDYSVEEDISREEAETLEVDSSLSEEEKKDKVEVQKEDKIEGHLTQYHVDKDFADRRYKVQSARTYFYLNEATCERNMEIFQNCLNAVADSTYGTGITAIKLTALGRPQILLQFSEIIMRARTLASEIMGGKGNVIGQDLTIEELDKRLFNAGIKNNKTFIEKVTKDSQGIINLLPWSDLLNENSKLSESFSVPCLKEGRMVKLLSQLSKNEEAMFRNMIRRLNSLVQTANNLDVRIMIDAEQTYFQPAISRLTLQLMQKYNIEKAIVFNTYQCYLKETLNEVKTDLKQAKRQKFYFGAKLVRGAYIDQERARAAALGYDDPTNPSFEATTVMYNETLTECLKGIKELKDNGDMSSKISIMVASHNEDTIRFALSKIKEIGISPSDKVICFGQLLGMCDFITFPLGQAGYSAYKYIPYGPVNEVLPYLSRRAIENKGMLKKLSKEKMLLRKELVRRVLKGQLFYKPNGNYTPV